MISGFIIENLTTQEQVTMGLTTDNQYLYKEGGVNWGSVPATHNTYNYPRQVGVSISSTKINTRDISIEGYVYYMLNDDERKTVERNGIAEYIHRRIKEKKKVLSDLINPDDYLRLYIGDYYIEGKPSSSIEFGKDMQDNNEYFCKFAIFIFCANPMFKKSTIIRTTIAGSTPAFHFPMIFSRTQRSIMSTRVNYLMLAVQNEGNVAIGGRIILKAKGEVLNPSIENTNTKEKIVVNKKLESGEKVVINTVKGKERGITGFYKGVERSYLEYWNYENSWFEFQKGLTIVGYSTENSSESLLDVSIEINPEKYALEDM